MTSVQMKDRIERLIRKNAIALGEPVKVEPRWLPDGRVEIAWRRGVTLKKRERLIPHRIYSSIEAAYHAAIDAHLRAHRLVQRRGRRAA